MRTVICCPNLFVLFPINAHSYPEFKRPYVTSGYLGALTATAADIIMEAEACSAELQQVCSLVDLILKFLS